MITTLTAIITRKVVTAENDLPIALATAQCHDWHIIEIDNILRLEKDFHIKASYIRISAIVSDKGIESLECEKVTSENLNAVKQAMLQAELDLCMFFPFSDDYEFLSYANKRYYDCIWKKVENNS